MVAWEINSGWRIADLGPIAAGFALIIIAAVVYYAMQKVGGRWAGVLTALGAAALIGQVLSLPGLSGLFHGVLLPLAGIGLLAAGVMRLMHHQQSFSPLRSAPFDVPLQSPLASSPTYNSAQAPVDEVRESQDQVHAIDDVHRLADRIERSLSDAERWGRALPAQPDLAKLIRQHLATLLPATQDITRRLAQLRAHTERVRLGHLAKIRRIAPQVPRLDPLAARAASQRLRDLYREARLGERIDRLDRAAVLAEQQITQTLQAVDQLLDAARYDEAASRLHQAARLGKQTRKLIHQIEKQQKHVLALAIDSARQPGNSI